MHKDVIMMGFIFNTDLRVHLNLSTYAWNIIQEDMFNFSRDSIDNVSGFINDIIENFYTIANSSIQLRCDEISSEIEDLLSDPSLDMKIDGSILYSVISASTKSFKKKVMTEINSYPKGAYKKIKLRKVFSDYLQLSSNEDIYYDGNIGNYIKALVEEYTRQPFISRERIQSKSNIDLINKAISTKKMLKVKVRSGKDYETIPYGIETDRLGMFNYLVGLDSITRRPVAYRISKSTFAISSKNGRLTKDDELHITNKLSSSDVSFLTNEQSKIIVRLDEYGIKKYNSQLHLRPSFIENIGNKYIFECSEDQIKYYFLKFGSSAVIEEPKKLRDHFRSFYKYALKNYQEDHQDQTTTP